MDFTVDAVIDDLQAEVEELRAEVDQLERQRARALDWCREVRDAYGSDDQEGGSAAPPRYSRLSSLAWIPTTGQGHRDPRRQRPLDGRPPRLGWRSGCRRCSNVPARTASPSASCRIRSVSELARLIVDAVALLAEFDLVSRQLGTVPTAAPPRRIAALTLDHTKIPKEDSNDELTECPPTASSTACARLPPRRPPRAAASTNRWSPPVTPPTPWASGLPGWRQANPDQFGPAGRTADAEDGGRTLGRRAARGRRAAANGLAAPGRRGRSSRRRSQPRG